MKESVWLSSLFNLDICLKHCDRADTHVYGDNIPHIHARTGTSIITDQCYGANDSSSCKQISVISKCGFNDFRNRYLTVMGTSWILGALFICTGKPLFVPRFQWLLYSPAGPPLTPYDLSVRPLATDEQMRRRTRDNSAVPTNCTCIECTFQLADSYVSWEQGVGTQKWISNYQTIIWPYSL